MTGSIILNEYTKIADFFYTSVYISCSRAHQQMQYINKFTDKNGPTSHPPPLSATFCRPNYGGGS